MKHVIIDGSNLFISAIRDQLPACLICGDTMNGAPIPYDLMPAECRDRPYIPTEK